MDITRLFIGLVMMLPVALIVWLVAVSDTWRSAVMALHLRWEREQRQAGASGAPLTQRQQVQTEFELLVSRQPIRLFWLHMVMTIAAIAFALILAWQQSDLSWVGYWLVAPFGMASAAGLGFVWLQMGDTVKRLAVISVTLYGPAPPRVKVRNIHTAAEPES